MTQSLWGTIPRALYFEPYELPRIEFGAEIFMLVSLLKEGFLFFSLTSTSFGKIGVILSTAYLVNNTIRDLCWISAPVFIPSGNNPCQHFSCCKVIREIISLNSPKPVS